MSGSPPIKVDAHREQSVITASPGSVGIMWLLKSQWSNPMKHLIPYLQDGRKAADSLRHLRWPDGVKCPRCGSDAVEPRERCDNGLQRFNCLLCAVRLGQQFAMFTRT